MGAGGDRRQDGGGVEPADAELCARCGGEPVQCGGARAAAARDADADAGAQGWQAVSVVCGAGGDSQDQNLLQFFLNVVEFGMNVQEATEAANFNSFQMRSSFGEHEIRPGRILLNEATPPWVRSELRHMGYTEVFEDRTSGPINA